MKLLKILLLTNRLGIEAKKKQDFGNFENDLF